MDFPIIMPNRPKLATSVEVKRPYRTGGMRGTFPVDAEYIDFDKAQIEEAAELCMDASKARAASALCTLARKRGADCPPTEEAVYIVAPKSRDACKVGISSDPAKRVSGLQTSHWTELELCGLFWCLHEGGARELEKAAHRNARAVGMGVRGEWFDGDPEMLAIVVMAAAKAMRIRVADSEMWMRQREAVRWQLRYLNNSQLPSWHEEYEKGVDGGEDSCYRHF